MKKDYEKLEMEVLDFSTNRILMDDEGYESETPDNVLDGDDFFGDQNS